MLLILSPIQPVMDVTILEGKDQSGKGQWQQPRAKRFSRILAVFADCSRITFEELLFPHVRGSECEESCNIFAANMTLLRIPASHARFHLTLAAGELGFLPMCICVVHEEVAKHILPNQLLSAVQ